MKDKPIIQLDPQWRLTHDRALQWILQYSPKPAGFKGGVVGKDHNRAPVYQNKSFHMSRVHLRARMDDLNVDVRPEVDRIIRGWPEFYKAFLEKCDWAELESNYINGTGINHFQPPNS